MPLDRDQFNQFIDLMNDFVTIESDRQPLMQRAFFGESVLTDIDYSGRPVDFTSNCIARLQTYNGDAALVQLLETLRDHYLGVNRRTEAQKLINELTPSTAQSSSDTSIASPATGDHIFISYSRRDNSFVNRLRDDLSKKGIGYWIDKEGLTPGTRNWERALRRAIESSYAVVWVVSPDSLDSDYVQDEIALAEVENTTLYPVWANGTEWRKCVPLGKGHYQYIDMRDKAYDVGLSRLIETLAGEYPEKAAEPEPAPTLAPGVEPKNPYKGLMAFQEDDASKFFGREALTAKLVERLHNQLADDNQARFLAILGPSGAGKSSVVMAGLIPALKREHPYWTYLPRIVPGNHPIEYLADALSNALPDKSITAIETDLYAPGGRMLHRLTRQINSERVVLYIDQFEELFTLTADESERAQFISLIAEGVTEPNGKLIVLLSMRADFLDKPLNYPMLGKLFNYYNELVQPMTIAELRDAIEKPAKLPTAGLTFDTGLVAEIIFALRGRDRALAGALPLLQFTLERLFEERDGARLTAEAYEKIGGVEGAIGTHSENVFSALPQASQDKLGQVFIQLVSIDESSGEPTRRRAPLNTVTADLDAKKLVDTFISPDARLLQTGSDGDSAYVEVAHEALLRSWKRLVNWIDESREDQITIRRMEREASIWKERGEPVFMMPTAEELNEFNAACARLVPQQDERAG